MSAEDEAREVMQCCASCGTAGGDGIKLKNCTACYLVKYCSVKCQKDHRPKHKKTCKKRAAELKDEILFKQPESSYLGDCPICCLPLPIDVSKSCLSSCCSKRICNGCDYASQMRESDGKLQRKTCPFCRTAVPNTGAEIIEQVMKRVEANDAAAICNMGMESYMEGNHSSSFEYWTKAAALGDVLAHYQLSILYRDGQGVEKDKKKELHHAEKAAIRGHPHARCCLGNLEEENGQYGRAVKHFIIGAKLGHDMSLDNVKILYEAGHASREDFNAALRGYQAAIEAAKSPQREQVASYSSLLACQISN